MCTCAILYAKSPEAGQVKTRLQSHLTAVEAAELYRAFLQDCAHNLGATCADRRVVAFTPASAGDEVRHLLGQVGHFEYVAQPEGDVGQRMALSIRRSAAEGATRTVIVGLASHALTLARPGSRRPAGCLRDSGPGR